MDVRVHRALKLLDAHFEAFAVAAPFAEATGHPIPSDTRAWSQVLVSMLTGISGLARRKGADLEDGSDVKAANTWKAIDTPRFNGCIPAGRKSKTSKRPSDITALNHTPHIFFVMWDDSAKDQLPRCRVWCVRAANDAVFRRVCAKWYELHAKGKVSDNFQLHPPRKKDFNIITNTCGDMEFPLLFSALRKAGRFVVDSYDPKVLTAGKCKLITRNR